MSVRNFGRVFTADIGTTPAKYVLHLRVEAARRLLQSTSHDLRHIATVAGFGSVDGMRRAFVRVLGTSPRELRPTVARRSPLGAMLRKAASTDLGESSDIGQLP